MIYLNSDNKSRAKKQRQHFPRNLLLVYLALHKRLLYTLVIGCRNMIAAGKPQQGKPQITAQAKRALVARHAQVVSSTLLLWWI